MTSTEIKDYLSRYFKSGGTLIAQSKDTTEDTIKRLRKYIDIEILNDGTEGVLRYKDGHVVLDDGDDEAASGDYYAADRFLNWLVLDDPSVPVLED